MSAVGAPRDHGHAEHRRAEGREKGAHDPCLLLPFCYVSSISAARQTCATSIFGSYPSTTASASTWHSGAVRSSFHTASPATHHLAPHAHAWMRHTRSLTSLHFISTRVPSIAARRMRPPMSNPTSLVATPCAFSFPTPLSRLARRHGSPPHAHGHRRWHRAHRRPAARSFRASI